MRDDQQFLDAGFDQFLRLVHHFVDGTAHQVAAQRRDDAEAAAMVAAFGNLQISEMLRGEAHALRRHQVGIGVVQFGQVLVHRVHHLFGGVRAGDGKHLGMRLLHDVALGTEAAGDDDLAVLLDRFADGFQRFGHGAVDEAAGVDHDQVRLLVARGDLVPFGAHAREDVFGIDGRLGTAERDEADLG